MPFFTTADPPPVIPDPPPLVSSLPESKGPKRIQLNGLWYDRFPDGSLEYCKECNRGKVPHQGAIVSKEEHDALIAAGATYTVPAVTVQPFRYVQRGFTGPLGDHHWCANCGREVREVHHWNPNGTHTHVCPNCGNTETH